MDNKEYFEKYGAPDNMKITSYIALSLKEKPYTQQIHSIKLALEGLDKKSLGRYLGKKGGNVFDETKEEIEEDIVTGDKYESLMLELFEHLTDLETEQV